MLRRVANTLNALTITIGYLFVSDIIYYGETLHRDPNLKNSVTSLAFL